MEPQAKKKLIIGSVVGVALLTGAFFGGRYLLGQMEERKGEESGGAGTGNGAGAGAGTGGTGSGAPVDEKAKCQAILATAGRGNLTPERQAEIDRCRKLLGNRPNATFIPSGTPIVGGVRGGAVLAGMGRGADGIASDFA